MSRYVAKRLKEMLAAVKEKRRSDVEAFEKEIERAQEKVVKDNNYLESAKGRLKELHNHYNKREAKLQKLIDEE